MMRRAGGPSLDPLHVASFVLGLPMARREVNYAMRRLCGCRSQLLHSAMEYGGETDAQVVAGFVICVSRCRRSFVNRPRSQARHRQPCKVARSERARRTLYGSDADRVSIASRTIRAQLPVIARNFSKLGRSQLSRFLSFFLLLSSHTFFSRIAHIFNPSHIPRQSYISFSRSVVKLSARISRATRKCTHKGPFLVERAGQISRSPLSRTQQLIQFQTASSRPQADPTSIRSSSSCLLIHGSRFVRRRRKEKPSNEAKRIKEAAICRKETIDSRRRKSRESAQTSPDFQIPHTRRGASCSMKEPSSQLQRRPFYLTQT